MGRTVENIDKLRYDLIGGPKYDYAMQVTSVCHFVVAYMKGCQDSGNHVKLKDVIFMAFKELQISDDSDQMFETVKRRVIEIRSIKKTNR
jgi:hypothetical protein